MQTRDISFPLTALALGVVLLVGCGGGNTADVTGTVTLDGKPLPDARVVFMPQPNPDGSGGGRPAAAITDSEGHYELIYGRGVTGAVPGTYRVEIRTYDEGDPDADTPAAQQPTEERVPAKYNADSELVETVDASGNVINFTLDSEGEIKLPPGAGGYGGYGGGGY